MGSGDGMIDFADILQLITWGILVPRSYTVTPGVVDLYYELHVSKELQESLERYREDLYAHMQKQDSAGVVE